MGRETGSIVEEEILGVVVLDYTRTRGDLGILDVLWWLMRFEEEVRYYLFLRF